MGHGSLLDNQRTRLDELCSIAGEMTDPERGARKNPRAVVKILYYDGFPREMSLELSEKVIVPDEFKQKKPGF